MTGENLKNENEEAISLRTSKRHIQNDFESFDILTNMLEEDPRTFHEAIS